MTIGSAANFAFAFNALRSENVKDLGPEARFCLVILSDYFGMGAAVISFDELHRLIGTEDPSDVSAALTKLARAQLIRMSDTHNFDQVFVASVLATDEEIGQARKAEGCGWPLKEWSGLT